MKLRCIIGLICLIISVPIYAAADSTDAIPWSKMIDIYRQCFITGTNCAAVHDLSSGVTPQTAQNQEDNMKKFLAMCGEAHVALSALKTTNAIIVHNYKLLECLDKYIGQPPDAITKLANWFEYANVYYDTEYQIGHMTKNEFINVRNVNGRDYTNLSNMVSSFDKQAQEIEQLKKQLASLQSSDHEMCRKIQMLAASNGATPQNCP